MQQSVRTRSRIVRALAVTAFAAVMPLLPSPMSAQTLSTPEAAAAQPTVPASQALCEVQVVGQRRIPKDSILARMSSHQGDPYDPAMVERDFNSIWNTGYFQKIRIEAG